jgi:acetyl esterase/lipase
MDDETIAPSAGLEVSAEEFTSAPDGDQIKVRFIRPPSDEPLPCVYYIHGSGMQAMSCFDGIFRAWGRMIANQSVAASSAPEVAPFLAGLNDCIAGVKCCARTSLEVGPRPASRRRSRTTGSCSTCTTTEARWPTASKRSRLGIRWRGRRSRPKRT